MLQRKWLVFPLLIVLLVQFSACIGEKNSEKVQNGAKKVDGASFLTEVKNDAEPIEGGTLHVALVNDAPFQGIFSDLLSEDHYDAQIMAFASNHIFDTDGDFLVTDGGIATLDVDEKHHKATIKLREGVKWSDGELLTVDDLIYPYEVIAHKDYTGVRYDADIQNVVGIEDYHNGKTNTISGLKKVDDFTLEISLKKVSPAVYTGMGDGIWPYAAPSNDLKDVPVKDLIQSDKIRKNPVTLGAFKFEKIVPGESVQLVRNAYYWRGKAKLDQVIIKTVPQTSIVAALKAGEVDYCLSMPTAIYAMYKDLDNITILGRPELSYSYLGFNLGTYDQQKNINIMNPNAKMGDVKLRQAMAYAINLEVVNQQCYLGLRERANSLIPPAFQSFYNSELKGYTYDPEKAKQLLDEAGYKDVNGDGIREDKNGQPFEIKMAFMAGGDEAEPIAQFYLQNWKDVGLCVTLTTGRLMEFHTFYHKVQANDKEIDMYMAAWTTGTNPSPVGLYGEVAKFNMSRFVSDENTKLLAAIDSKEAMDLTYRIKAFQAWQVYMAEQVPVIPTQFRTELIPVNHRVKGVNIAYDAPSNLHEWELTAKSPIKASKS